jgi:hypothetical protein
MKSAGRWTRPLWLLCLVLTACGGGGGGAGGSPQPAALVLTPSSVTLDGNTNETFQPSGGQAPYVFAVSSGAGSINAAGMYTAPSAPGTAVVTVTDSLGTVARSNVTVNPPLTVAPGSVAVAINTTQGFTAVGGTAPYTYAVTSGVGTVDASSGLYRAPSTPGTATLAVTDALRTTTQVTVIVNGPLSVLPTSITITSGSGQSYAFKAQDGALEYKYSLLSGPGSIDATGIYTAGTVSGTSVLQVTDRQGNLATATINSIRLHTNGPVYAAVTDGTQWYLGGAFTAVNPYEAPRMAVVDPQSGAPQLGCDLQRGFDGEVLTALYSQGGLYVSGYFAHYRGAPVPGGVAKLDATTCALSRTYFLPTDLASNVTALTVSGSALYLGGTFSQYQGTNVSGLYGLIKVDANTGVLDPTFAQGHVLNGTPHSMVATPSALYCGGDFNEVDNTGGQIVKLDATTGGIDVNFKPVPNVIGPVYTLLVNGDALYVGGYFSNQYGNLLKVDAATGALDTTFTQTSGFNGAVRAIALSGSSLYVAGESSGYRNQSIATGLAKIDAQSGALDPTFANTGGFNGSVNAIAVLGSAVYAGGAFTTYSGSPAVRLAKLDAITGSLDPDFTQSTGLNGAVDALTVSDSSLYAAGQFRTYRGVRVTNLAKIDAATTEPDAAFTHPTGFDGPVKSLVLQGGSLYAAGSFTTYAGQTAKRLAKLDAKTAALDSTFTQSTGFDTDVSGIAASSTSLYVAGNFLTYRGISSPVLAKLDLASGALDTAFTQTAAITVPSPSVSSMAVNGSYVYVGHLGRFNASTGAYDPAFSQCSIISSDVTSMAFGGGWAYLVNSTGADPVFKCDLVTGARDTAFAPNWLALRPPVSSMTVLGSSLYAASANQTPSTFDQSPIKIDVATGTTDTNFSQGYAVDAPIRVLSTLGASLYLGGDFTTYRGSRAYYFVPVDPTTGASLDP